MKVKIKRIDKSIELPKYQTPESAGFDFICRETVEFGPRELKLIPSNNIIKAPHGYFLAILPRSSTFKKKGLILANSMGVVDPDYSGERDEIGLLFYNITDQKVIVEKGERIAQGIFIPFVQAEWGESDDMGNSRGGFGSTG